MNDLLKPRLEVKGEWFYIVCINEYEFEGTVFYVGDISRHCWGYNIPKNWKKATETEYLQYLKQ